MQMIEVQMGSLVVDIELNGSDTAQELLASLPIKSRAKRWGDEIYFSTPVDMEAAYDAREIVDVGDVAYWPPDRALCLFFGPTPCSTDGTPQAASAVNMVGKIKGRLPSLVQVNDNSQIEVRLKVS